MRIDLPMCNFKNCKWYQDSNCYKKTRDYCEYYWQNTEIERLQDLIKEAQQYNEAWVEDNGKLRQELKNIIVRCKDCKYHEDLDGGVKCQRMDGLLMVFPDDYCSYGRRIDHE